MAVPSVVVRLLLGSPLDTSADHQCSRSVALRVIARQPSSLRFRRESTFGVERSVFASAVQMPGRGLEPLRISPPDPKSGASANFATLAMLILRNLRLDMDN